MAVFTNRATLSYNGKSTASNTVTGEIVGALTVTKTALSAGYSANDIVSYIVTLVNNGQTEISGITLTDDLGAFAYEALTLVPTDYIEGSAKYFVNGVKQADPQATGGDTLVISGVSVPAGGSAVVAYSVRVNEYAPLDAGGSIKNTVSAASARLTSELIDTEEIPASGEPVLDITKSLCPLSVEENGSVTYTFVIANYGAAEADAGVGAVLNDTFSPALTGLAAALDNNALELGTDYTYDEATGEFATLPGVITLPAATFSRDETGMQTVTPAAVTLTVTGTV